MTGSKARAFLEAARKAGEKRLLLQGRAHARSGGRRLATPFGLLRRTGRGARAPWPGGAPLSLVPPLSAAPLRKNAVRGSACRLSTLAAAPGPPLPPPV